jgi:hypothetical protein
MKSVPPSALAGWAKSTAPALADYGQSYEKIQELHPFPASKEDLIPLALAIAIPAFPVIIAQIPVAIVLKDLLDALR